jgi:TIGR00251 family protein
MSGNLPEGLITETSDGVTMRLHLQPRSSRTEICGIQGDELKVRVTAPPVEDAANRLCIEYFAKLFKLPKSAVSIISGHKSRHKRLLISGVTMKDVRNALPIH